MPKSFHSIYDNVSTASGDDADEEEREAQFGLASEELLPPITPISPAVSRKLKSAHSSEIDFGPPRVSTYDERSSLLGHHHGSNYTYTNLAASASATPRARRQHSGAASVRKPRQPSRSASFSVKLVNALTSQQSGMPSTSPSRAYD
jgi:hypothetical protein